MFKCTSKTNNTKKLNVFVTFFSHSPSCRIWPQQTSTATSVRSSTISWVPLTRSIGTWPTWETTRREPNTGEGVKLLQVEICNVMIFLSRFSSKTLMSLLPADELKKIEDKVERQEMVVDFYDILGEVQKNKPAA